MSPGLRDLGDEAGHELEGVDFDADRAEANAREVAPHIEVVRLSCKTGEGLEGWTGWLARQLVEALPLTAHPV